MPRLDPLDPRFGIKYPKPKVSSLITLAVTAAMLAAILGDTPIHAY